MTHSPPNLLFFIHRIYHSSYPLTETGYSLLYRALMPSLSDDSEIYVTYPDSDWHE